MSKQTTAMEDQMAATLLPSSVTLFPPITMSCPPARFSVRRR
jgi:hypothetical protein